LTIDCNRLRSRGGALYYVDSLAELKAVLVDSPGIDTNAPWPKYQHDLGNTGNGSLPNLPLYGCHP
jgi:hypothetical protein